MSRLKPRWPVLRSGHPLARKLVAAYLFQDLDRARCRDLSLYSNTGTGVNTPSPQFGFQGAEVLFAKASDQYYNVGNPTWLQITDHITIATWFKLTSTPGNISSYQLVTKDKDTGGRAYTMDAFRNDGAPSTESGIRIYVNGGLGAGNILTDGVSPVSGDDKFVVGQYTINGPAMRLFVNGALVGSSTPTATTIPTATANVLLARREYVGFTEPLDGVLRFVYIWNRLLSAAEVYSLYLDPYQMFAPAKKRVVHAVAAAAATANNLTLLGVGT